MFALNWLGPLLLRREGAALPLPVKKTQALVLLLAGQGQVPRERVAVRLWPQLDESTARRNLRRELARLREGGATGLIQAEGDFLALAAGTAVDALDFEVELAAQRPDGALALWRGTPADGLRLDDAPAFDEWLMQERVRLQSLRAQALASSAAALEARGAPADALRRIEALLQDDPLQEQHHRSAIRLLLAMGRREAALAQFETCRQLLADELGLEPMSATRELVQTVRAAAAASAPSGGAAHSHQDAEGPGTPAAGPALPAVMPFAGRQAEVQALEKAWREGVPVLIEGDGGIGKTRLATDFAAAHGPFAVVRARPGDAGLPYAVFTRGLRALAGDTDGFGELPEWVRTELSRLLPELGPMPAPLRNAEARTRLAGACVQAWLTLALDNFDAVLIDDWHHADAASQHLLVQVAQRRADLRAAGAREILLLRPELGPEGRQHLEALSTGCSALHLVLQPLPADTIFQLVQQLSGAAAPARFAQRLGRATGGNPFFIGEMLRHGVEGGWLQVDTSGTWTTPYDDDTQDYRELPLPASVRDAVLGRVRRLPEPAQRVLEAAALADEPFAPQLLAPACALSEVEASLAVEVALDAGLLREHEGGGLAFAHDLVQQALDAALAGERRRSVHRRLALGSAAAGAAPALVAAHHEAGGEPARAVTWRRRAADDARRLHALDDAIDQWQRALADGADAEEAVLIGVPLMRTLALRERDAEAIAMADTVLAHAAAGAGTLAQRIEARIAVASLHAGFEDGPRAMALLQDLPASDDPRLRALALRARSEAERALDRLDESSRLAAAALAEGGLLDDERAQVLDGLVLAEFRAGRLQQALRYAEQSLAISRASHDGVGIARGLGRRAALLTEIGDFSLAEPALREVIETTARMGMLGQQRSNLFNLCVLYSAQSRPSDVLRTARECWSLQPPIGLERLRTQLRLAFVEAHCALGDLGEARRWTLGAIDDAMALMQLIGRVSVRVTCGELMAMMGESPRLAALVGEEDLPAVQEMGHAATEMWMLQIECALLDGDLALARQGLQRAEAAGEPEPSRLQARLAIDRAAMCLAEGNPGAALALLPTASHPGLNDELRWRSLAVRLQAEAAQGDELAGTLEAAEAELQRNGVQALAAFQLHRALLLADDTAARREGWNARVRALAATLADEPERQAAFLRRWRDPTPALS